MTGDLVQTASCQNYRSGFHIETLPGYVIDGNIKLSLSYVIKGELIERVLLQYPDARFEFDAPTQRLVVPGTEVSIPLGYAIRRQVLRLGTAGEEPVVLVERAYLQNHAISSNIEGQQIELMDSFVTGAGARIQKKGELASYPASRNPGGVYSDAGRGKKHGAYTVTL